MLRGDSAQLLPRSFLCAWGVLALLGWYVQFANLLGLEDPLVVPDHMLAFFDKIQARSLVCSGSQQGHPARFVEACKCEAWFPFVFDGSGDPEEGMLGSPSASWKRLDCPIFSIPTIATR